MADARAWWLALVGGWVVLCLPLLVINLPPLNDYPNHLARMVVLSRFAQDPALSPFYQADWGIIPDLAIDAFMPTLVAVMPPLFAGKLLLAGILLLEIGGAAAYATAVHGRRTWWALGAVLAGHNIAFMMGFLNFDLSFGLSMLMAAGWIGLRRRRLRFATAAFGAAGTAVLFFCHLMGLFFFLALIGSFEAWSAWVVIDPTGTPDREGLLVRLRRALAAAAPLAATILPVVVLYPLSRLSAATGDHVRFLTAREKLLQMVGPFENYHLTLDLLTCGAVWGLLLACLLTRRLVLAPGALLAIVAVAVLYVVLPIEFKGTGFLDTRLSVMLGFLAFTAVRPVLAGRMAMTVGLGLAALLCVRVATVAFVWTEARADMANLRALAALVRPGDRVLQFRPEPDEVTDYWNRVPLPWRTSTGERTQFHMPAYFFVERSAFWPYLFADPDQQPIRRRQPYDDLARVAGDMPRRAFMWRRGAEGRPPAANPYCAFDVVMFLDVWAEPDPTAIQPAWLEFVAANSTAALYRVRGARSCSPPPGPDPGA